MNTLSPTPYSLGYRMPGEWEPHEATILTWPHLPPGETEHPHWPGFFAQIPAIWARMTKELEQGEDVHIVTHDAEVETLIKAELKKAKVQGDRVHLHRIPSNFSWARDHGPITVKNNKGERLLLDWGYNAWGNQWAYELDDAIPARLASDLGLPSLKVPMVLEGGSIDVNGKGTLLTTEDCLLNPDRNPDLKKEEIEKHLCDHLGVTKVIWLKGGIKGDDTSGHVDDLARFIDPTTVVVIVSDDPSDIDYPSLQANWEAMQGLTDQDGQPLTLIPLIQPKPVIVEGPAPSKAKHTLGEGFRIPASYANFYIGNECVLLPVWDDPKDAEAADTLQKCFPNRRIVPIDSRILTWGFGSFHCVTQQIPAGA